MSDERKELLKVLDGIWFYYSEDFPTVDITKEKEAVQQIRKLIQQQPEIDEKWLENKTFEMIDIASRGQILEAMRFIKSIVNDVKGRNK